MRRKSHLLDFAGAERLGRRRKQQNDRTMTEYTSDLLRLLDGRGYIHQVTDAAALDALAVRQSA